MSPIVSRILRLSGEERRSLLDAVQANRVANPVSYVQTQMWALEQLNPGSPNHLVTGGWKLRGPLDTEALAVALNAVIARHASLRTHFVDLGGAPLAVEVELDAPLAIRDLTVAPGDPERLLADEILDNAVRPFDLERGSGFRAKLLKTGRDVYALIYAAHHIVFDGWSQQLLARDLGEAYRRAAAGDTPLLAPLPATYADFAAWQQSFIESGAARDQLEFWRSTIGGELPLLELPFSNPRPAARSEASGTGEFRLSPETIAALDGIARDARCTRFPVLLAALKSYLSRIVRQRDIIIGTPVAGRPYADFEQVIGYFVNMVAVRTSIDTNVTFRELVERVAANVTSALDNQELPFQSLLEMLNPPREAGHSPVFQAAFVYDNYPEQALELPGVETTPLDFNAGVSLYDVNVLARDLAIDPAIRVTWRTDLFDDKAASRFVRHLERWIGDVARRPGSSLRSHSLLSAEESTQILVTWNQDRRSYSAPPTIHGMFEEVADRLPSRVAVVWDGGRMQYSELEIAANRLANKLLGLGVAAETPVAIYLKRRVEMIVAMLAVLKAGGAYLPLDPDYPAARISYMFEDSGASVAITSSDFAGSLPPSVTILRVDDPSAAGDGPAERPHLAITGDHLLYVMYTSGSTGLPKGVMVTHGGVRNRLLTLQGDYKLTESDRVLNKTTFSFDVSVWEIFLPLVTGAAIALPAPEIQKDSKAIVDAVRGLDVTMLHFIPPMLRLFLEESDVTQCTSLRHVVSGGELLPKSLQMRCFELLPWSGLNNHYGPTEGSIEVTSWRCGPNDRWTNAPIGRAVANVPVYILDDDLNPVPIGISGELYFGGVAAARGYRRAPGRTAERFLPDPFTGSSGARLYRTGDMVRFVDDGIIEFLGRIDHQVKIRGFRVELGEVQAILEQHSAVLEALVDAETDKSGSSQLRAYLVARGAASTPDVVSWLSARLPEFMLPTSITWLERVPLTETGKIDRKALPPAQRRDHATAWRAPRSDLERELCAMWSDTLSAPELGIDDDFFAAGGHSLLGLRILFAMEQRFGVRITLKQFLQARTVAAIAAVIDAKIPGAQAPAAILPMPADAQPVCSYGEERLWFIERFVTGTPAYVVPFAIAMRGTIDAERLRTAFELVVARHDILRTSYIEEDGVPVPRVTPPGRLDWVDLDLRPYDERARREAWQELMEERCGRPFAVDGSLVRAGFARFADDRGTLVAAFHHLIVDGWSIKVIFEEIAAAYSGGACPPSAPVQYRDYAYWGRGCAGTEAIARDLAYWTKQLAGTASLPVPIPLDRPYPPLRSGRGGLALRPVSSAVATALTALGRSCATGEFAVYVAALAVLLARYGASDEVVIGTPVSGRDHPATESMIGFLSNQLVLRIDIRGNERFRDLAVRVHRVLAEALDHQTVPFAHLVQHLNPCRATHRNALFDVGFAIEDDPTPSLSIPGASVERIEVDSGGAKFDLEFILVRGRVESTLSLTYNRDILDQATAEALLEDFDTVLADFAAESDLTAWSVRFPSREVRSRLIDGPAVLTEPPVSLRTQLTLTSRRFPSRIAVDTGAGSIDYAGLESCVRDLSLALEQRGMRSGALIGVLVEEPIDLVKAMQAIVRIGAAYLPMVSGAWATRAGEMFRRAEVAAVLTTMVDEARKTGVCVIDMKTGVPDPGSSDRERMPLHSGGLFYGITTSGSTGVPKLASSTERGFTALVRWFIDSLKITGEDRVLIISSPVFDLSQKLVIAPLVVGASLHWAADWVFDPVRIRRTIASRGITIINATPTALRLLLDASDDSLASLRWVVAGGEAFPASLAKSWLANTSFRGQLMNSYGVAECADISVANCLDPARLDDPIAIGRPIPGARTYVLDQNLLLCPIGVQGELFLAGAGVGCGYIGEPAQSAERFLPDPFDSGGRMYRTGDLARWRRDGSIEYIGRRDHQVKVRGQRVELGEVERTLASHPAVRAAAAVVRTEPGGEAEIAAYYTAPTSLQPRELRQYLESRLPGAMVPRWLVPMDVLPRTETGKVDRLALPAPAPPAPEPVRPEADSLEESVCAIWRDVLCVEAIGPDDNFFSLGGHSLLAIRAVGRIRDAFGVDLPLRSFFNAPTLRRVARLVAESPAALPAAEDEAKSQPAVLAPAQEAIWFAEQFRPDTPMHNHSEAFLVSGKIDVDALEAALNRIASRHDVLRTAYRPERAGVRAIVLDGRFPFLRMRDTAGSEETVAHHIREEIRTPFLLASAWPVRARWVDLGGDRSLLILTAHHIAYDGWSHAIFLTELSRHYEAIAAGSVGEFDPPRKQYADLARLQIESLGHERVDQARQAWSKHLEAVDWNRSLPRHDGANRDDIGSASQMFTIDSAATVAIQSCARALGVTPFAILLAGLRCALGKWTGYRDDCVGIVAAARPEAFADVIGLFSNPLPLFVPMPPELSFQEWVKRCQEKIAEALSLQDVPIARALAGLRPDGEPRPEPPFEVTFALQESAGDTQLQLGGSNVRSIAAETESATFPLQFFLTPSGQIFRGEVIYRRGWLRRETVTELIRWFAGIVSRGAGNPGIGLNTLMEENTQLMTGVSRGSRRRLPAKPETAVSLASLTPDGLGPVLMSPSFRDVDLAAWVRTNNEATREVLRQHGAVLFRGFGAIDKRVFEEVATSVAGELVPYVEGSSPRRRLGRGLYTSTEYPRELPISMHNELSYAHWWPRYLFFYCRVPAETGGETPLADSRAVLQFLKPSIVDKFRAHGVCYLRRLRGEGPGPGLSWQEVFETDDPAAVERYCREGEIAFEWTRDGGLRTRQHRHALINHPETGQLCWFNQVHQWHSSNLSAEEARLIAGLPPEERPLDATYGDGSEFDEETLAAIREAYASCQITFRWEAGDIVAVDNMAIAHGRRPFTGPREVLVLLGGRVTAAELAHSRS